MVLYQVRRITAHIECQKASCWDAILQKSCRNAKSYEKKPEKITQIVFIHFGIHINMKTRLGIHSIFHLLPFVRTLINIKLIGLVH